MPTAPTPLVNEVPLETYLRGVVPHEIAAPYAAVEAQAISEPMLCGTYAGLGG